MVHYTKELFTQFSFVVNRTGIYLLQNDVLSVNVYFIYIIMHSIYNNIHVTYEIDVLAVNSTIEICHPWDMSYILCCENMLTVAYLLTVTHLVRGSKKCLPRPFCNIVILVKIVALILIILTFGKWNSFNYT